MSSEEKDDSAVLLAGDIGGTNSRFSAFRVELTKSALNAGPMNHEPFERLFATSYKNEEYGKFKDVMQKFLEDAKAQDNVVSFGADRERKEKPWEGRCFVSLSFWSRYLQRKVSGVLIGGEHFSFFYPFQSKGGILKIAACCLAVAGPVSDGRAAFTNRQWVIDAVEIRDWFGIEQVRPHGLLFIVKPVVRLVFEPLPSATFEQKTAKPALTARVPPCVLFLPAPFLSLFLFSLCVRSLW